MCSEMINLLIYFLLILIPAEMLKVEPPNIITPHMKNLIYIDENGARDNKRKMIPCVATGSPQPTYFWLRNNNEINPGGTDVSYDQRTGNLTIRNFNENQEGDYVCVAMSNINGMVVKTMSPTTKIIYSRICIFSEMPKITKEADAGHYISVGCNYVSRGTPAGQFMWYWHVSGTVTEIKNNERIFGDSEGSLHFAYLEKTDNNKTCACAIYNGENSRITTNGRKITLKVKSAADKIPESKPESQYKTLKGRGFLRGKTTLECFFSGNPAPDITWFNPFNDKITFPHSKYSLEGETKTHKLEILDLVEEDEGTYKCTGSNSLGSASADIFLNITSPPIVVEGLHSQTVTQGKDAEFTCVTRAASGETEPPPPTWYKNARDWSNVDPEKYIFSDNKRRLTVKNVNKLEDISCFQCRVENDVGSIFGDGCLNVILPIKIIKRPPKVQAITKGDIVNLTVIAIIDEDLNLKYAWLFNGGLERDIGSRHIVYNPVTHEAYINTSMLTDDEYNTINGTYIRKVFHVYDAVEVSTEVVLKETPVTQPVIAGETSRWWITLIIAFVVIFVIVIIIAITGIFCSRKQQEGVYPLDRKERAANLDPEKDLADSGFHDLSRSDWDQNIDLPFVPITDSSTDDVSNSTGSTGDIDPRQFNEDGSFIGQYVPYTLPPPAPCHPKEAEGQIWYLNV